MEVFTIDITALTSSFRYPNILSGFHPSLEVPPISTVLGLINCAAGRVIEHKSLQIGYYFQFDSKYVDLETIYMRALSSTGAPTNLAKTNIMRRQQLIDNYLRIYVVDEELAGYFEEPKYPLTLGRADDLATVENIGKAILTPVNNAPFVRGQIIPFMDNCLPGTIMALPAYFTKERPRQSIGTKQYSVINHEARFPTKLSAFRDTIKGQEIDIYMHSLNLEE